MTDCGHTAVLHDAHPLWLEALEVVLASLDIAVVGKATTTQQALSMVKAHKPDMLLVDTGVADRTTGTALVREALECVPSLRVIAISGSPEPTDIDAAFDAGVIAYVVKTAHPADVAAALRQAFGHSIFLSRVGAGATAAATGGDVAAEETGTLTRREREILALVAQGHSNRELAQMLWVTEQTIKFHLSNIYRKVGAANRTQASSWAHKHLLLENGQSLPLSEASPSANGYSVRSG